MIKLTRLLAAAATLTLAAPALAQTPMPQQIDEARLTHRSSGREKSFELRPQRRGDRPTCERPILEREIAREGAGRSQRQHARAARARSRR